MRGLLVNVTDIDVLEKEKLCQESYSECAVVTSSPSSVDMRPYLVMHGGQVFLRDSNFILNERVSPCPSMAEGDNYCVNERRCMCGHGGATDFCCCASGTQIEHDGGCHPLEPDEHGNLCAGGDRLRRCSACGEHFRMSGGRCLVECDASCQERGRDGNGDCVCDCGNYLRAGVWGCDTSACSGGSWLLVNGTCYRRCSNCPQGTGFYADAQLLFTDCASGYRLH